MDKQTQKKLLAIVEKNYDQIAKAYNETRKKKLGHAWEVLLEYAEQAKDGDRVLDVGCGNGRLLEAYENKQIKYLGVDQNEGLLEFARKQRPGHEFRQCDFLSLGKLSETDFDWVFSVAVLHHLPGRDLCVAALKQLKNKIKPDGKIIITVWNMWSKEWQDKKYPQLVWKFWLLGFFGKNKMDFGDILVDWKNPKGEIVSKRYYHAFRKRELGRIAKKAGLKIERLFKDKYNYYLVLGR